MNNILTIKVFGDVEHKYGPYFRIGYRDKEATFSLLDKDKKPITDVMIAHEIESAADYIGYSLGEEGPNWVVVCIAVRDLYVETRNNHE